MLVNVRFTTKKVGQIALATKRLYRLNDTGVFLMMSNNG